jgi:PAS domain S-box-containing protein
MQEMFGLSQQKMRGKYCWEIVHCTKKPVPDCPSTKLVKSLKPEKMELRVKDKIFNVRTFPVLDDKNTLSAIVHIVSDITESKKTQEIVKDYLDQLKSISEKLADGMVYQINSGKDGSQRIFSYLSPAVERLHGVKVAEAIQRPDLIYGQILEEDLDSMIEAETRAFRNMTKLDQEVRTRMPSGEIRWRHFLSAPRQLSNGDVVWDGIEIDITERKQAEEDLKRSRKNYQKLFEDHSAVKLIINPKTGNILDANFAAADFYGWTREEMKQMNISQINTLPPDEIKFEMDKAIQEQKVHFEFRHRRADSSIRDVEVHSSRIEMDDKIVLHSIVHDITDRKKIEDALRLTQFTIDRASDSLLWLDEDANIIYANDAACSSMGFTKDELTSMKVFDIDPDYPAAGWEKQKEALCRQKSMRFESRHRTKDGRTFPVEVSTNYFEHNGRFMASAFDRDITLRKKAEEVLFESNEKYRILFEDSPDPYLILGDDEILNCNRASEKMFGSSREKLIGVSPAAFSPMFQSDGRLSAEASKELIKEAMLKSHSAFEWTHIKLDGTNFPVEVSASTMVMDGRIVLLCVLRDISERKKAEDEISQLNESLERRVRERTAELEAFSYSVSHDLRAPLRTIDGFGQALLEDYENKLDERAADYIDRIRKATITMGELIDDMLILSRITRSDMDTINVNLSGIARSILEEYRQADPDRKVHLIVADALEDDADPRLIRIVLENLLGNAWKFTELKSQAEIEFGIMRQDKQTVYFVRDNGAGFDMAYADKLFAPFQRLHNTDDFTGTGIGLAIVKRIIARHGGDVWAEGDPEKGATFYFTLH